MSKPEDVSQEAWDAAWGVEAWARPHYAAGTAENDKTKVVEIIARALMAAEKRGEEREREACADLSIKEGKHLAEAAIGSYIAKVIRKRGEG
jgi:hypothetical protein